MNAIVSLLVFTLGVESGILLSHALNPLDDSWKVTSAATCSVITVLTLLLIWNAGVQFLRSRNAP